MIVGLSGHVFPALVLWSLLFVGKLFCIALRHRLSVVLSCFVSGLVSPLGGIYSL